MLALVVALLVDAAAAVPAQADVADVLVLDLRPIGVPDDEAKVVGGLVNEAVLDAAKKRALAVATSDDLRTIVNVDATQRAAGCDDASCMAEIAGAFGAAHVVTGTLGQLGGERVLQLWLMDVKAGRTVARETLVGADARALTDGLPKLVAAVLRPLSPVEPRRAPASSTSTSALTWTGGAVLGASALAAAGLGVWALVLDGRLAAGSGAASFEKREALDSGPWVLGGAAAAAVVALGGGALLGVGLAGDAGGAE